jgi:hypothetical protein
VQNPSKSIPYSIERPRLKSASSTVVSKFLTCERQGEELKLSIKAWETHQSQACRDVASKKPSGVEIHGLVLRSVVWELRSQLCLVRDTIRRGRTSACALRQNSWPVVPFWSAPAERRGDQPRFAIDGKALWVIWEKLDGTPRMHLVSALRTYWQFADPHPI